MRTAAAVLLSWTFKEGRVCGFWDFFFWILVCATWGSVIRGFGLRCLENDGQHTLLISIPYVSGIARGPIAEYISIVGL